MFLENSFHAFRILVVEDDPDMRALLVDDLRDAGYVIDEAANGLQATAKLMGEPIDLMITDMDMPTMNGIDLLAFAGACYPFMPVITMSGARDERAGAAAAQGFVSRHLVKPLRLQELRTTIERALEARPG